MNIDIAILLSITTGKSLVYRFNDVHKTIAWLIGEDVFEVEAVMLQPKLKQYLIGQYPELDVNPDDITEENVLDFLAAFRIQHGPTRFVVPMT